MSRPFIQNRATLEDASELIEHFGELALVEAASRAARSRGDGNVLRFCHWRQIERVIAALNSDEVTDTIH